MIDKIKKSIVAKILDRYKPSKPPIEVKTYAYAEKGICGKKKSLYGRYPSLISFAA